MFVMQKGNIMKIKLSSILQIEVDDDKLVNWAYEKITGIYTFNFTDGSTWKYESKSQSLYQLANQRPIK